MAEEERPAAAGSDPPGLPVATVEAHLRRELPGIGGNGFIQRRRRALRRR